MCRQTSSSPRNVSVTPVATLTQPTRLAIQPNLGHLDPLANGTRNDCEQYDSGPVLVDALNSTITYACDLVAAAYNVTVEELIEWNPDLAATAGLDSVCELDSGARYCVQPKRQRWPGLTEYCVREVYADPGFTCSDMMYWTNNTLPRFNEWNPEVGANCEAYRTGALTQTSPRSCSGLCRSLAVLAGGEI
jgi:hypothetical protein